MSTNDSAPLTSGGITPDADTMLAGLAVMECFQQSDYAALDTLMDSTDPRELVMGLLDISLILTNMFAQATGNTTGGVVGQVREDVLSLVSAGTLGAGVVRI